MFKFPLVKSYNDVQSCLTYAVIEKEQIKNFPTGRDIIHSSLSMALEYYQGAYHSSKERHIHILGSYDSYVQ